MSFMQVDYKPISVNEQSKYSLYRYSHPRFSDKFDSASIPVIFIPGNRGSYKQARTIGSWFAQHKSEGSYNFTVYTLNLLEEFSVLSNKPLRDQSAFVKDAIEVVQSFHQGQQIVLVGHSMGGIVARLAFSSMESQEMVLVTLAAPQTDSPLDIDDKYNIDYKSFEEPKSTINISGGWSDCQILPVGQLESPKMTDLNVETIPMVWSSSHHQAIVWIHPVVEFICRKIQDLVK